MTLRPLTRDDTDALLATRSISAIASMIYEPVWDRAMAEERVAAWVAAMARPDSGFMRWVIERTDQPGAIGDVFEDASDELYGSTEVGYVIHPDYAGHGYATEATRAAVSYARSSEVVRIGCTRGSTRRTSGQCESVRGSGFGRKRD